MDFQFLESYLGKFEGGEAYISKEYWSEGIAILYLNNPQKKNAISGKMMVDLRSCVSELENWKDGKAVIFCGKGSNFCSGGDLDFARATGTQQEGFYMSFFMQDFLKRFRKLPFVTVSLVHGPALGGGAELTLISDYILVTNDVKLGFVHGKMGISTAWGGATRLVETVGRKRAMEMLLTAKIYNAHECLDLGLAYKVIETDKRFEEALDFVKTLTKYHCSIVQSFKRIVGVATEENFEKALSFERDIFSPKWGSDLNRDALNKRINHISDRI